MLVQQKRTLLPEWMGTKASAREQVRPLASSVRNHSINCDVLSGINDFKVLYKASSERELRIVESVFIRLLKPTLNQDTSAFPLHIF